MTKVTQVPMKINIDNTDASVIEEVLKSTQVADNTNFEVGYGNVSELSPPWDIQKVKEPEYSTGTSWYVKTTFTYFF